MSTEMGRPTPPRHNPFRWPMWILLIVLVALVFRQWRGATNRPVTNPDARPREVTARGDLAEDEKSTIELFRFASPTVVHITTELVASSPFSLNPQTIRQGTGSGFIWDKDGHVVTNFHVIQNTSRARVTLADHSSYNARYVGGDPDHDLAVLEIEGVAPDDLMPIPVGSSSDLQVGQKVFAIGNPFGLDQTLTTGVISGLGREIQAVSGRTISDVIQTDAAINPGNSGGPLLDSAARLIGVNTAIASPSGAYAGVGFAVPVDTVNRVVPDLIRYGRVKRPGIGIVAATDQLTRQLLNQGIIEAPGVLVMGVEPESGAERAGLLPLREDTNGNRRLGDLITAVDDEQIESLDDLLTALEQHEVGDVVTVAVLREGQRLELDVELEHIE